MYAVDKEYSSLIPSLITFWQKRNIDSENNVKRCII